MRTKYNPGTRFDTEVPDIGIQVVAAASLYSIDEFVFRILPSLPALVQSSTLIFVGISVRDGQEEKRCSALALVVAVPSLVIDNV